MNSSVIRELLELFEKYQNSPNNIKEFRLFGSKITEDSIKEMIDYSVTSQSKPDIVLKAIFESIGEENMSLLSKVIRYALKIIHNGKIEKDQQAESFTMILSKYMVKIMNGKSLIKALVNILHRVNKIETDKANPSHISSLLLSIVPPLYRRLYEDTNDITINEETSNGAHFCNKWIEDALNIEYQGYCIPSIIEVFSELSLTDEQVSRLVSMVFRSICYSSLPSIAEKLLQMIKNNKKLVTKCVYDLIMAAINLESMDKKATKHDVQMAQCGLIKTIHLACTQSKNVMECVTNLLSIKSTLPVHFTPFLLSLSFYLSRVKPKIDESIRTFFYQQLKEDYLKSRSRFLSHIYTMHYELVSTIRLESVVLEAIELARTNLESNIYHLIDFAFELVDKAQPIEGKHRIPSKIRDTYSNFAPTQFRQVEIGVKILYECASVFPSESNEIFRQIVQRLLTKSPNSMALIRILRSPEFITEMLEKMQYLELPALEQLLRFGIPRIIDNDSLLDRVMLVSRKAFFNRSEQSKINGVVSLFYLIQPRREQTYTQVFNIGGEFGQRSKAVASEDLQHEIFNLLQRGLDQSHNVKQEIYLLIPLLIRQNSQLCPESHSLFTEKISQQKRESGFPLVLTPSMPYLIQSLCDSINVVDENNIDNWEDLKAEIINLSTVISDLDFDTLTDNMALMAKPENRDILFATLSVLFNFLVIHDQSLALTVFSHYDRVMFKRIELDQIRKDNSLKSAYHFRSGININFLSQVFDLLVNDHRYQNNFGIQLYAFRQLLAAVEDVPSLRLEFRLARLQLSMELGRIILDGIEKIKICDPPSGFKGPQSLIEILTNALKKLIVFVIETYDEKTVIAFLKSVSMISENERISDGHKYVFRSIKKHINSNQAKCVEHFCSISETLSLLDPADSKFFASILKLLRRMILSNSFFAGKILRLARAFSPSIEISWLCEVATQIKERLIDEENGVNCTSLNELIDTLSKLIQESEWVVSIWIPRSHEKDPDQSPQLSSKLAIFLRKIGEATEELIDLNFLVLQQSNYEKFVKYLVDYLKSINHYAKKTDSLRNTMNDEFQELVRFVVSSFGNRVSQIALKAHNTKEKKANKRDDIDSKIAPELIFQLESLQATTKSMIENKIIDPSLRDDFCKIQGADFKMKFRNKKEKKELVDDNVEEADSIEE